MKKFLLRMVLATTALVFLAACSSAIWQADSDFKAKNLNPLVENGSLVQKVDGFVMVMDTSLSMAQLSGGQKKMNIALDMADKFNKTIPTNVPLKGALVTVSGKGAVTTYGVINYTRSGFEAALTSLTTEGLTPIAEGIDAASALVPELGKKVAIILVSDGLETEGSAIAAVKALKEKYGSAVCIYPVIVGNDCVGCGTSGFMGSIASILDCGYVTYAENLGTPDEMARFVTNVFFNAGSAKAAAVAPPPMKSEDGDADGDGVGDAVDQCPNTPKGAEVDERGCWVLRNVNFDFDKADIKSEYFTDLDKVVRVLQNNPDVKIQVEGHTDYVGSEAYNQDLSERRAASVKQYFVSKGIDSARVTTKGYGKTRPMAVNDTADGRAKNRRIELTPSLR